MISEAKTLRFLVKMYLLSTTGSNLFLLNKFVRMIGVYFVIVVSFDDNELIIAKCPPVTDNFLKYLYEGDQQQRRDSEVAAVKKIEIKKPS